MAAYTHGHHESVLRSHGERTAENSAAYLLPRLAPGMTLLDIGAGPGTITVGLAERVGHVTATEIGEDEIALSRTLADERGVSNLSFAIEDVQRLSFPDDCFDIVHAHQVLQHVPDPVQALRETRRVAKPGGIVAARDADYAGFLWYPLVPELETWLRLYRETARANGGEPDAGRRLHAWARRAGFSDIVATASTWCYATPEERRIWGGSWADRIVESAIARQLVDEGRATRDDLRWISDGWRAWAEDEDGWFLIPHGEILCRVPDATS